MYGEEHRKAVKDVYERGVSKAAIARALGMSRTTVRRFLELKEPPTHSCNDASKDDESLLIRYEAHLPAIRAFLALARERLDECRDTYG